MHRSTESQTGEKVMESIGGAIYMIACGLALWIALDERLYEAILGALS